MEPIPADLLGYTFVWVPPPAAKTYETVANFTDHLVAVALTGVQGTVIQLQDEAQIESKCRENFNLLSECFAAVVFDNVDPSGPSLNYTLRGDLDLRRVNVDKHASDDTQARYLPLQSAIERVSLRLRGDADVRSELHQPHHRPDAGGALAVGVHQRIATAE